MHKQVFRFDKILKLYLGSLNFNVSQYFLDKNLIAHPHYPSLLAIRGVLSQLKVPSLALHVNIEELKKLPTPLIGHKTGDFNEFIIIEEIKGNKIHIKDLNGKTTQSLEEFQNQFSGNILIAEPNGESKEADWFMNKLKGLFKKLIVPFFIFISIILLYRISPKNLHTSTVYFLISKAIGTLLSIGLIYQRLIGDLVFLNNICSFNKHTDCNKVLTSKSAKLFGLIPLSDVGFIYFLSGFSFLFFRPDIDADNLIRCLSLLVFPFTIYSIYYQWKVIKKWCVLCLFVQAILVSEAVFSFILLYSQGITFRMGVELSYFFFTGSFILSAWIIISFFLKNYIEIKESLYSANEIKYEESVLKLLSKPIKGYPDSTILFGNPDASNKIILVTSPTCGPCSEAHQVLEKLLHTNPDDFCLIIVFGVNSNENTLGYEVITKLVKAYLELGSNKALQVFSDWYTKRNQNVFPQTNDKEYDTRATQIIANHEMWAFEMNGISATPTIVFNNHFKPDFYKIEELKYFF